MQSKSYRQRQREEERQRQREEERQSHKGKERKRERCLKPFEDLPPTFPLQNSLTIDTERPTNKSQHNKTYSNNNNSGYTL